MTCTNNARAAGAAFLLYIAAGIASMVLFGHATGGAQGTSATLASIAGHAATIRLIAVLGLFTFLCAVVLGVTLYALTRDQDRDLALLALCCRASEGVVGAVSIVSTLGLLSVATASTTTTGPDAAAAIALGGLLLKAGGRSTLVAATCFAIGSTLFAWLFLRARSIPVPLAWLGLLSSALLVVTLPLQLTGFVGGPVASLTWLPIAVFELVFGPWLIIKGVAAATRN